MDQIFWCSTCNLLLRDMKTHESHDARVFGYDKNETISALDDVIEYGLTNLNKIDDQITGAQKCRSEIDATRQQFLKQYNMQIERCVKSFRESLENCGVELLHAANQNIRNIELKADAQLRKSKEAKETVTAFIQQAATIIPEENGSIEQTKLNNLFQYSYCVSEVMKDPADELVVPTVSVKIMNSLQVKTECSELATRLIGQLEVSRDEPNEKGNRKLKKQYSI